MFGNWEDVYFFKCTTIVLGYLCGESVGFGRDVHDCRIYQGLNCGSCLGGVENCPLCRLCLIASIVCVCDMYVCWPRLLHTG